MHSPTTDLNISHRQVGAAASAAPLYFYNIDPELLFIQEASAIESLPRKKLALDAGSTLPRT